jgi:hypothetical protein
MGRKTSRLFLADQETLLYLANVARRSRCRPSQLLELSGMSAYLADCRAAEAMAAQENHQAEDDPNVSEW